MSTTWKESLLDTIYSWTDKLQSWIAEDSPLPYYETQMENPPSPRNQSQSQSYMTVPSRSNTDDSILGNLQQLRDGKDMGGGN